MALNQGPQPRVVLNENGVRYVDPNPTDEIVNHEDLVMYVKLVARSKGRSILTYDADTDNSTVIVDQKNVKSETNFTYPTGKDYIDTSWTNIGGGNLNFGEDLGSFGITNINIEFKSSFMPQIVIDFVDVRGAALFEQGPCSPYALFFHLPYPVFELTVKGYYGRPVTYTLALVKFNTKFNSDTGNFESKGEFVGYTYAFLADIPMGYVMAAGFMEKPHKGSDILAEKWKLLLEKMVVENGGTTDSLPSDPINVYDLIKSSKKLEQKTGELKNSAQVTNLGKINKTKNELNKLRTLVFDFKKEFLSKVSQGENFGQRLSPNTTNKKDTVFIKLQNNDASNNNTNLSNVREVVEKYFGDGKDSKIGGTIGASYDSVVTYYTTNNLENPPNLSWDTLKTNSSGFFNSDIKIVGSLRDYYIDLWESLLKPINVASEELNKLYVQEKDKTKNFLNNEVIKTLGFLPTISNVFAIILTNVEVFLELLLRTSRDAEQYHQDNNVITGLGPNSNILDLKGTQNNGAELSDTETNNQKNKVYPWPTYYEKKSGSPSEVGEKETYPGENSEFVSWPEVIFVEAFIKALTKLKGELAVLDLQLENLPGYDNFAPITPYETHAFGRVDSPNRWLKVQEGDVDYATSIYKIMGENAFILGDYTMINSLTLWKSQLGFKNGWGQETLTNGGNTTNISLGYSTDSDRLLLKPQRLIDNPKVNTNLSQSDRWGNKGFTFSDQGEDTVSFRRKVVPATKKRMKDWGYVDALNLMTTLKLDNGQSEVLTFLKGNITTGNRAGVIDKIKEVLKDNLKIQTFLDWKKTATAAIGGTETLINKQSGIWNSYFGYVKTHNVLTLTGPILLNDRVDSAKDIKISANPHNNDFSGARLVKTEELAAREIDFSSESLPETITNSYKKYFADTKDSDSKITEGDGSNLNNNSLAYTLLKYRPKTPTQQPNTAYVENVLDRVNVNLSRDKNTNMLTLGTYFASNFYHTYEKASKDLSSGTDNPIFDIASSRTVYNRATGTDSFEWANFMGASVYNTKVGSADSITNTPLWLLNNPLWKNSWNYHESSGDKGTIALDEIVSIKRGDKKDDFGTYKPNDTNVDKSFQNHSYYNQRRNWSTWWGLNQWGSDSNTNIYKPLAYMAIMSFGFDNKNPEFRTGYFPPWDGDSDENLSSFSNFTYSAIMAYPPKAYILMIGAILWRMKESGLLFWDNIKPSNSVIDNTNKGWNKFNKSFLEGNNNIGIDDLNDPVWFFHTSTSRPWYKGGSVFSIKPGSEIPLGNGTNYERRWLNNQVGIDRWTNGGGAASKNVGTQRPVLIGPNKDDVLNLGSGTINNSTNLNNFGWVKSHNGSDNENSVVPNKTNFRNTPKNIDKGWFDQCRPDQIPFILIDDKRNIDFKNPKTLVITNLSDMTKKINYTTPTPNLIKNNYPILKEECKELLFIPKSLKEEFIQAFEEWATGENSKWLLGIDPLNWNDNGAMDSWTTTNGSLDNGYVLKGYKGFLSPTVINDRKYLTFNENSENNFYLKNIETVQEVKISGVKTNTSKTKSTISLGDYEEAETTGLVSGSKIKLNSGENINIEDLVIGDIVVSYNTNTKTFGQSSIEDIKIVYKENLIIYKFDNEKKLTCTDIHAIWVPKKGWSAYRPTTIDNTGYTLTTFQIAIGDECLYYSNNAFNKVKITNIFKKRRARVWSVNNNGVYTDNFIVNNFLVHN